MLLQVANFMFDSSRKLFQSMLTDWGIIGLSLIGTFLLIRVANFMRRFFK